MSQNTIAKPAESRPVGPRAGLGVVALTALVNSELMRAAGNPRVKFMHCLPAFHNCETKVGAQISARYPHLANGIEVTEDVFESPG